MFGSRTAVQVGRDNPVLKSSVQQSALIYSRIPLRDFIDDERRNELARRLYLDINEICNSLDPLSTCRDRLVQAMMRFASYQVLVIPAAPAIDASGLRSRPGISGELMAQIDELAIKDDELRSALYEIPESQAFETVWDHVQRSYWEAFWFLESINSARKALGDYQQENDWFGPFMHAACASRENVYRAELALPSAFDESLAHTAPTAYSIYTDIILAGADDPDLEWRDYHRNSNVPPPRGPDQGSAV